MRLCRDRSTLFFMQAHGQQRQKAAPLQSRVSFIGFHRHSASFWIALKAILPFFGEGKLFSKMSGRRMPGYLRVRPMYRGRLSTQAHGPRRVHQLQMQSAPKWPVICIATETMHGDS